ncbi:MAG: hypothetical protein K0R39_3244 [Symbiobacteriaceae bacterium]|jgi:hypothetical protein|nr:hypothetical protein [Symbiobacteriaceae bacterium]
MTEDVLTSLLALTGKEITLRFANAGVSGRLVGVRQEAWGYVLHLSSAIGDHFVPFPGEVLHIVAPR